MSMNSPAPTSSACMPEATIATHKSSAPQVDARIGRIPPFLSLPDIFREGKCLLDWICSARVWVRRATLRYGQYLRIRTNRIIPPWRREFRRAWKSKKLNFVVFFEPETSFTEHGWHLRGSRLFFRDSGRDGGIIYGTYCSTPLPRGHQCVCM